MVETPKSPGDYGTEIYSYINELDPTFKDDVTQEEFIDKLQGDDYANKIYAYLASADQTFVNDISLEDFVGNVKKKEVTDVTESVSDDGSSVLLPITEVPEGGFQFQVNEFGQQVDEEGVPIPVTDSPFERVAYNREKERLARERAKEASGRDTPALRLADQMQAEEMERFEQERDIAARSMPSPPEVGDQMATDYIQQLRDVYGPYGIRFETDYYDPNDKFGEIRALGIGADGNAVEFKIDVNKGKIDQRDLSGLTDFLQSNARAKGGVEVDKRSLSEKALKVQQMRPVARLNEDGSQSTVLMASAEADGRHFAYPTLFPTGDGFSADPSDWSEMDADAAFAEAQRRGELFEFDTAEEAQRFAEGEWKEIRETDAIAEQMWAEKGRNYYADEMFLRELEEKKREYEFLEALYPGEDRFKSGLTDRSLEDEEVPIEYQQYLVTTVDREGNERLIARTNIEEIRQQKERELAALEQQFDNDNELLRLKEDYDELLGKKRGEVMERAATLNQEGKAVQNRADVASINRFGVPVKGLLDMQPQTEGEYNEMLGLLTEYNTGIEQRRTAALQYEKNKLYYDAQHEKLINQEYVDGWEEVSMKWSNGLKRGNAMSKLLLMHYGYYDVIGDEGAEEEAMREVSAIMDSMDTRVGRATSRTNMTGTTESFFERINPLDAGMDAATYTAALTAESLGQLLPIWYRILPVAAVGGAVYGAAGGPLGSTFGAATTTIGAAGMGALAAVTTVGMPVSELALELGNSILEVGERKGYDWADPNSALLALNDESVWKEGADRGYKRGIPIALTGMVSNMAMAKAALGGSRVLPFAERLAVGVGTGVTIEPATEMLGEYAALRVSGEYTGSTANVKEIAAEGLGAIGMGVGFTTSIAALGYAKDVVTDANFDLALRLMDPAGIAQENVRGERIVSWANRMERLGKIDAEQAEAIRKNVGRRRQANELLGKKIDSRPGSDSQVIGRIVELLEAKEELERSGPNVFGEKIRSITEEIALIAESGKVEKPGGAAVNLSDIRGRIRNRRPGVYKFNGKKVTREDFLAKLQEATPRQLKRARAYNDIEAQLELISRRGKDAVQKRKAAEILARGATAPSPEVGEEVREANQEDLQAEEQGTLDLDRKDVILDTIAEKLNDEVELTEVEQAFLNDNEETVSEKRAAIELLDQEAAEVEVLGEPEVEGRVPLKRLKRLAANAKKAIAKNFEGANIIIHNDKASYQQAARENNLTGERSAGFLSEDNKTVHVFAPLASETTIAHETFHVILRNSVDRAQIQELMGEFVTTLKKVIPADKPLAAKLDEFQKLYDAGNMNEEYVAEFFGELAAAYPTLDKKGKSVIARFVERLGKLLGVDLKLSPDLTKRDQQILSLLERLAGQVSRGETVTARETGQLADLARPTSPTTEAAVEAEPESELEAIKAREDEVRSEFREIMRTTDGSTRTEAENARLKEVEQELKELETRRKAEIQKKLRAAEQRVADFSDEQIQAMADEGVIFHFSKVDITKVLPEKLKRFVLGYGFYFTDYALEDSTYRSFGDRFTMVNAEDFNLLDGDAAITEQQAKALRSSAKTELQEAEEYGDDLGFEESQVLMSLADTKAGERWADLLAYARNDERRIVSELTDEQRQVPTRLIQEMLGFDGVVYGQPMTMGKTGAITVVWNFPKIDRAIIEPTRAAEQRVDDLDTSIGKSVEFAEESTFDNKIEFKRALQERFNQLVLPELEARYGITDSSELNDNLKEYLVDAYMNETLNAIAAYPDALGWYDSRITGAMSLMSLLHPELATDPDAASAFKIALAITSNGNKVYDNFVEANRQYKYYKENGKFDESRSIGNQVGGILSNLKFANEALGVMSMEELTRFLTTKHKVGSLSYRDSAGKKKNLISGFGVNEEVYGAAVFGPKIGNGFFMNLYGVFDQLTMDRWFMRQYGRLTGTLLDFDQKKVDTATKRLARARKALLQRNSAKVEGLIGAFENLSDAELAQKVQKASMDIKKRAVLKSNPKLDEFRKASNNLAKLLEAEVEAPTPAKRRFINEVFSELQQKLKDENGIDITIADLQAVNWYPEKALYQTFKADQTQKSAKTETSDNEQPDYESAARKLVEKQGVTKEQIDGRQIERDDTAREADQQRAAELLEDDEAVSQLRDRVLSTRNEITSEDLKPQQAAEQRVSPDTEGPTIVYRSGAVDSKAEPRGMMSGGRSTGHFGTGAYFFSDRKRAKEYDDRDVTAVDIRDYNLAPASKKLHDALRDVNTTSGRAKDEFSESDFFRVIMALGRYDEFYAYEELDLDASDEVLQEQIRRNSEVESRRMQLRADAKRMYNEPGNVDSRSTVVMKVLGYDGVYARPRSDMDNSTYGTVIYDVKTEPRAAEQRVAGPELAKVLQRYEFKPNNSLKNAELAPELRRNLKRFGFGVKQYGTRMNDFRVVSLDTGRAVDPNKLIEEGLAEGRAMAEDQRAFEAEQRARELEERIIEIYNADERPFTGKDFEARGVEQKVAAQAMAEPGTIADLVTRGRELGLRDAAIRSVLLKRFGKDNADAIDTALTEYFDMFRAIPEAFGNVEGGIEVGRQIYDDVRRQLDEFARPKKPGRMTKQERTDRIAELRAKFPEQKNLSDTELLRKHPRQAVAPSIAEVRAEALNLLRNNRSFNEQTTEVQEQLLVAFDKTLQTKANKQVNTLISQIRNNIRQRRKGAKNARTVQTQLRKLINEVIPRADYTKSDVNRLNKLVAEVNEDNYFVKAEQVLKIVDKKREQIRQGVIKDIVKFVRGAAKTKRTPTGKVRPRSLDAPGQAYFREADRILRAILDKDQSLIMDIAANLANNPLVDVATQKMLNGEKLTTREQQLVDQKSALDMFADIKDKSLEEVEAILDDLKVDAGFSRANLKATRAARAERMNVLREGAKAEVQGNWAGFATNEDGSAKTRNQLEAEKTQKKTIGDALKENGLRAKYDALVEWAKEGKRLTPAQIARTGKNITHVGSLTGIMGEFFRENLYKRLGKLEERHLQGIFETQKKLDEIAATIDGIENYRDITDLIFTSNPDGLVVNTEATGRRRLSTDEMMRIYALSKNPVQRAKLERMGFTDAVLNQIVDAVDSRLLEFVDKTVEYLANDYYESINDVYRKVNDINLGYIENYFPTRTQVKGDLSVKSKEETLSSTFFGPNAQVATALKERTDQKGDILMDQNVGFHGELGNHFNTMERFKAYAEGVQEMNAILSSDYTVALAGRLDADAMLNILIAHGVTPDMFMSEMRFGGIDTILSKYTGAALAFKLMQIVKQATSALAGYQQYTYGERPNAIVDLIMFSRDYAVLLPKILLEGITLGKYKGPIASIAKDSATFRARLESNFSGDVYGLTAGVSGRPRKVSEKDYKLARKAASGLRKLSGSATAIGDILGVLGYLPAYNRNRQRGMSQEEAIDRFNEYNETQQSRRPGERAPIQIYRNGLVRLVTAFTSSQILYLNNSLRHANNISKAIRTGQKVKAEDSRGLIFNTVMASVLFTLASNAFLLLYGSDEEKQKAYRDTLLSPIKNFFAIPVWGAAMEEFYNLYVGNKYPSDVTVNPLGKVVRDVKKVATDGDVDGAVKSAAELALGTNLDPGLSLIDIATGEPVEPELYDLIGVPKSARPE